jgi:DnaJ-class molecular chaperone
MANANPSTPQNTGSASQASTNQATLNPGDEARPGTPGTGEDICPECHGKGRIGASPCPNCGGSGKITRAIGGA